MRRACDVCGGEYEARRKTSRYCSTKCRTQASRAGLSEARAEVTPMPAMEGVIDATRLELEAAGRLNTAKGQVAMLLARRLETPTAETGSAVAALARQWQASLDAAMAGAGQEGSALQKARDELADRRQRRRGA